MIKENDYIRAIKQEFPQLPPEREWDYRQQFRRMPNSWKQSIDRERVKHKQNMSFSEWWAVVTENVRNGTIMTEMNQEIKRDGTHDSKRRDLNDNEHREYLGLDPYTEEDYQKIQEQYDSNVEGKYQYPQSTLPESVRVTDDEEEEAEISEKTLEMMDNSMKNLDEAEIVDMDEVQKILEEE